VFAQQTLQPKLSQMGYDMMFDKLCNKVC